MRAIVRFAYWHPAAFAAITMTPVLLAIYWLTGDYGPFQP